jgi:hypothetical protein
MRKHVTERSVTIAHQAIAQMGGDTRAAEKIAEMSGRPITRERVAKWKVNGIATGWHPAVHMLTGIPLHELEPEIYPTYLFPSEKQRKAG